MAVRHLYLVRHGQFNADEKENPTGGLTPLGVKQAKQTARAFKAIPISAIHVSTAPRALQTAEPFIEAFPEAKVSRAHRLLECVPPITAELRTTWFQHLTDDQLSAEALHAERAFDAYFKRTAGTDKHELLIFHGNLIRYLACRVMEVDPTAWINLESRNCGITRITVDAEGVISLVSYNEIGHLPPDLHTDNMHVIHAKNGKK